MPPPGTPDEFVDGLPIGGGFRVPCIIVSPWTAGGWVASEPFDHTSVLQFLERCTGVRGAQHQRLAAANLRRPDLRVRLPPRGAPPPRLPDDTAEQLVEAQWEVAHLPKPTLPGAGQRPPRQERGRRRRR